MCDALRSTPTIALNAILHVMPIDNAERYMAAKVAIRLRESGFLNEHMSENSEILTRFDFVPDLLDRRVAKRNSGGFFTAHIPARKLWVCRVSLRMGQRLGEGC